MSSFFKCMISLLLLVAATTITITATKEIIAPCPNMCNGRGKCTSPYGVCECIIGYTGSDCSQRVCSEGGAWTDHATDHDIAHGLAECSNRGICNRENGHCECQQGFQGVACERFTCPDNCNLRGRCVSSRILAHMQDPGMLRREDGGCLSDRICQDSNCNEKDYSKCFETYEYTIPWDADMIYGCICDKGYSGHDCSIRSCATGDDPLTGNTLTADDDVTLQDNDVQLLECQATSGTFTLTFLGETTKPIPYNADIFEFSKALSALHTFKKSGSIPNIAVNWLTGTTQVCTETGNDIQISFLQNFGDLSLILPDGSALGNANSTGSSITPIITSQKLIPGTKESDVCSNRGFCDEGKGVCNCIENWMTSDGYGMAGTRGDCGHPINGNITIVSCPGEPACLGFGSCSGAPEYRCQCQNGRKGPDCSLRTCPKGKSWFSYPIGNNIGHNVAECSNMGICDTTNGKCQCNKGYTGSACEYLKCPGAHEECNGNGECASMELLATQKPQNSFYEEVYSYGQSSSSSSSLSWDSNQVRGCLCSKGWEGYDCSLKSCIKGDDPQTLHQANEIQYISCTLVEEPNSSSNGNEDSYFQVLFDGKQTIPIYASDTIVQLKNALNSLSTATTKIHVNVDYIVEDSNTNEGESLISQKSVCSNSTQLISIEFLRPTGTIPLLGIKKGPIPSTTDSSSIISSIVITEEVAGTKEYRTCSGRGICDDINGICECHIGYGSSDGQGHPGLLGDCGYKSPIPFERYWENSN